MAILSFRSTALWLLGYPEAALADTDRALKHAREIGQAATLMYALTATLITLVHCGNYATATMQFRRTCCFATKKAARFGRRSER